MNVRRAEVDAQVEELRRVMNALERVSTGTLAMKAANRILAEELARERGPRKLYIKRVRDELISIAKATLGAEKLAQFLEGAGCAAAASQDSVLAKILERGEIRSEKEHAKVMTELDDLLQAKFELSEDEQAAVDAVNELILAHEKKIKAQKVKKE